MHLLGFDELTLELRLEPPAGSTSPPTPTATPQGRYPKVHLILALQKPLPAFDWRAWALAVMRNWAVLFAIGLLLLWRARTPLAASGAPLRSHPWRTLAIGLLVLVVALNLFVVALLLMALLFALGLGLNALGLWQISIALWVLAYSILAIALTLLWLFIMYGTKIIVSYHFASWAVGKVTARNTAWLEALSLFVGTLIYTLLRSAPYVGWAIGLLVIAAGMGSAWLAFRSRTQPVPSAPIAAQPRTIKRSG
jgi:hypothetical protein